VAKSTSEDVRALLADIGFREVEWVDERENVLATMQESGAGGVHAEPLPLGIHVMLGPQFPEMVRNVGRNLREDRLTIVQAAFARP